MTRRAKTLTDEEFTKFVNFVTSRKHPNRLRDLCAIFLSFKGGLRSAEIVGLDWEDVLDSEYRVGQMGPFRGDTTLHFTVPSRVAKKGHGRQIPMHPYVKTSLEGLLLLAERPSGPIFLGREGKRWSANALQQHMIALFQACNLYGCSSHSGRRTLATKLVRAVGQDGRTSLKDVMRVLGHHYLSTTEAYIEHSEYIGDVMLSV